MAEPTLTAVFGAGATQTATHITIAKADLDLTASATNRAEQLLAAIAKKAAVTLTLANYNADADQSISIAPGFDSIGFRTFNNTQSAYLNTQLTFNFSKVQTSAGVTPNDY